jgi:Tol biopolymer transport system component
MLFRFALRRGYQLLREGKWESALEFFHSHVLRSPRAALPLYEVGKLQFKKGDLASARQSLLKVLTLNPTPDLIEGILEITNWWMISSPSFFNTTPCFSPDGKKLLFCSARQDTNGDGKLDATDRAGIYLADITSSSVTEVVSSAHHNASPIWSPDGRSFLYFSSRLLGEGNRIQDPKYLHLMLRDLETREDRLLVPASLNPRYPVFMPDGRNVIVCTVDVQGGASGLSMVNTETMARTSLTSHAWEHTFPQVSPDGHSVMYISWRETPGTERQGNPAIFWLDIHERKEKPLVNDRFSNAFPRFSPDGSQIVFLSRRRDTNQDGRVDHLDNFGMYTLRLFDRKEVCVASDDHYNKFPTWSPDGKSIVFVGHWLTRQEKASWQGDDYFEYKGLYQVSAEGGKATRVVSDKFFGSRFCEVSPTGSTVAYVSWRPRTNRGLYIADYQKPPTLSQLHGFIQNNLS